MEAQIAGVKKWRALLTNPAIAVRAFVGGLFLTNLLLEMKLSGPARLAIALLPAIGFLV